MLEGIDMLCDLFDGGGEVGGCVEFISPGAITSLDGSIELWRSRRQDIERDVLFLAGGLELGHVLRAAVDLDGLDGPGHFGGDLFQEVGGVGGGGVGIGLGHGPFGEDVIGIEVLDGSARRDGEGQCIDLDDIAGVLKRDVLRLADGVGPGFRGAFAANLADQVGDRRHPAALDQLLEDAADGSVGHVEAGLAQERPELVPAPERKVEPEPLGLGAQRPAPAVAPHAVRSPALRSRRRFPAVERRTRHAHRRRGLIGVQSILHRATPSRHRVASSLRFDIWGLRAEKTRRPASVAGNMTGQAKNLHGVLLSARASQPELRRTPPHTQESHICLNADSHSHGSEVETIGHLAFNLAALVGFWADGLAARPSFVSRINPFRGFPDRVRRYMLRA